MTRRARGRPRTRGERATELDQEDALALLISALIVVAAAPVAVVAAVAMTWTWLWRRWPWWPFALLLAAAAAWVSAAHEPLGTYLDVYRQAWHALEAGTLPATARTHWPGWLRSAAPVSTLLAILGAAGGVAYVRRRRPAWEPDVPRRRPWWRTRRTRRKLAADPMVDGDPAIGVGIEDGRAVTVPTDLLDRHVLALGTTGTGKTTTCERLIAATIQAGGPVLAIDLKGDPHVADRLARWAAAAGRRFRCWRPDSDTAEYDPLAAGDASERTAKLVGLEEWSEPHYRRAAERYLQLLFRVLEHTGRRPTMGEVVRLLRPADLLGEAQLEVLPDEIVRGLADYSDGLPRDQASAIAGLRTRLATLSESTAGRRLQPSADDDAIDVRQALRNGEVVLWSLDSQRYGELAAQLATLVVQDIRTASGARISAGISNDTPVGLVWIDEFSAVDGRQTLALLARARAARLGVLLATQELADLEAVSEQFAAQVVGNCNTLLIQRLHWPPSVEQLAAIVGTEIGWRETIQVARISGLGPHPDRGAATGEGSLRQVDEFRLHPNRIKQLPDHRAVVVTRQEHLQVAECEVVRLDQPAVRDYTDVTSYGGAICAAPQREGPVGAGEGGTIRGDAGPVPDTSRAAAGNRTATDAAPQVEHPGAEA